MTLDLVFKISIIFGTILIPILQVCMFINQRRLIKLYRVMEKHLGEHA